MKQWQNIYRKIVFNNVENRRKIINHLFSYKRNQMIIKQILKPMLKIVDVFSISGMKWENIISINKNKSHKLSIIFG